MEFERLMDAAGYLSQKSVYNMGDIADLLIRLNIADEGGDPERIEHLEFFIGKASALGLSIDDLIELIDAVRLVNHTLDIIY